MYAVYPGSFDPFTNGHLDILKRSTKLFSHVIIAILHHTSKKPFLNIDERLTLIQKVVEPYNNIQVKTFNGLLVDFCKQNNINVILRGLRTVTDFDYEYAIAMMNKELLSGVETVFLTSDKQYSFISSTIIREVALLDGDVSVHVPPVISDYIKQLPENRKTRNIT